ncbi:hypothetical protein Gotri_013787 [Gossypium trilobum]|uniref:Uncharacterized protein n=1 Tax=Gossypium trilobum TaxID=34281 RepID=A0A7J9DUK6_9ROSI|nr:hypothetical protein [Gossypium trilobum]
MTRRRKQPRRLMWLFIVYVDLKLTLISLKTHRRSWEEGHLPRRKFERWLLGWLTRSTTKTELIIIMTIMIRVMTITSGKNSVRRLRRERARYRRRRIMKWGGCRF